MSQKPVAILLMLVCSVGVAFSTAVGDEKTSAAANGYTPVMETHHLMVEQDRVFGSLRALFRADDDKERFEKMGHDALVLAELANINTYHERAKNADYLGFTNTLKAQALALSKAASTKDLATIKSTLRSINTTCGSCHDKYQ